MRGIRITTSLLATLAALAGVAASAIAGLGPNPANDGALLRERLEGYRYDSAWRCTGKDDIPRGTKQLVDWLDRHTAGSFWGSNSTRPPPTWITSTSS